MSQSITVYSVQSLEELQASLLRYQDYALRTLEAAALGIRRALDWLVERQNFWLNEVRRREEFVRQAAAAFNACNARTYYDAKSGRTYQPDCSQEWRALERAKLLKAEAEHELHVVNEMLSQVQRAHERYQREAQKLTLLLRNDVPQSVALLKRKVAILRSTLGGSSLGAAILPGMSAADAAAATTLVGAGLAVAGVVGAISTALPAGQSDAPQADWIERGIQLVRLDLIDLSDSYVQELSDYKKVAYATMVEGIQKFAEVVLPAVRNGANAGYFDELDRQNGMAYEHGYRRVYDAFYGSDPIRLEKIGNSYKVVGGYHRLAIARQLGLAEIPASVVEKQ
jgi:hypothetical protein